MASLADQVRRDAASLEQFVSSISHLCEYRNSGAAYLRSSEKFFDYIIELASATKKYLRSFPGARSTPAQYLDFRDEIAVLRAAWRFLHAFVKPALDGDTLHLPTPLIVGLINRFGEITAYGGTDFVIYHTDEFNYLNVRLNVFKRNAGSISSIVQGPPFPDRLGLIGIPYSQASSLFMNCLIPHEMGHYVFGDLGLGSKIRPALEAELLKSVKAKIHPLDRSALIDLLARWMEELFCDMFAVRLVGFCFTFAFIELFDTSKLLDEHEKLSTTRSAGMLEFDDYPPDVFRVRQQARILKKDGWWEELLKVKSHYVSTLAAAENSKDGDYTFSKIGVLCDPGEVLTSFYSVIPLIEVELDNVTRDLKIGFADWNTGASEIAKYLSNGVVPSSLLEKVGEVKFAHPSVVTLLNEAYRFHAESLDDLIAKISGADKNNIAHRTAWSTKVEMWTSKAIEDISLARGKV